MSQPNTSQSTGNTIKTYSAYDLSLWRPSIPFFIELTSPLYRMYPRLLFKPKVYQTLDVFASFYFSPDELTAHLKQPIKTMWQKIIQSLLSSQEYIKINRITQGSISLSMIATYQFFAKMIRHFGPPDHTYVQKDIKSDKKMAEAAKELDEKIMNDVLKDVEQSINEYVNASETIESAISHIMGAGGQGFSHEALSIFSFLKNPDEFRRKVQLLRQLSAFMKYFYDMTAGGVNKELVESVHGGVNGVTTLRDMRQIVDILPVELALPRELTAVRIMSRMLTVRARAADRKIVVFVDKSGSMANTIDLEDAEGITKISVAAGLALALYRRFNADVYLFDTEVEKVSPKEVVKTLLTIMADGGTSIASVFNVIESLPRNTLSIIISDGIDKVDEEYAKRIATNHKVAFIILPYSWEYDWLKYFNVVKPRTLKDFLAPLM